MVGLGVGLILLGLLVAGLRGVYADRALPGTELGGVPVGGASDTEILRRMKPLVSSDEPVVVVSAGHRVRVRPSQLGYTVDLSASVDRAMAAGRNGPLGGALSTLEGLIGGHQVPLIAAVKRAKLRASVAAIAERFDQPSFAGRIDISPRSLEAEIDPPRAGTRIDREELARRLKTALLDASGRQVIAPVERLPAATDAEVERVAERAAGYVQQPLLLVGPGQSFAVSEEELARLLALEPLPKGDVRLGVDAAALGRLVARVAELRGWPPRDARIIVPARPAVIDEKGNLSWQPQAADAVVEPSRFGRLVDRSALADQIEEAVSAGRHRVPLPVRHVAPTLSTGVGREVKALIGTFTTYFEPGQPRVANIQQMAAAVDGAVVPPGQEFSLNDAVGPRTRAKGYVPAPFIADNKIVLSVGGGVSQFSTTMYNAVYFAGLEIDAYQPHSLFIDRYPPGREATLDYPEIDLRWTNDTQVPVLVRTASDETSVSVSLYGDNGGRQVRATAGAREPAPGGDFTIVVTRTIRFPDGRTERHPHTTRYELPG